MKAESQLPRLVALAMLAVIFLFLFTGCVSSRYREAKKDTPAPKLLNVAFAPGSLGAELSMLITYNGPGSWKRDAFWDEYVVTLHNPGKEPLAVSGASLVDYAGTTHVPGDEPWVLEKRSKTLEQKYKEAGIAFVRYATPGILLLGTSAAVMYAATPIMVWGPSTAGAGAATTAATATLVAIPIYYAVVLTINHRNKVAMEKEFARRRLVLPLTLAPGEARTGSLFFPMVPNPRSLGLHWSAGSAGGDSVLPLDFLHGLHAAPAAKNRP